MKTVTLLSTSALVLTLSSAVMAAPPDQPGHVSPLPGTTSETMSTVKDTAGHAVGTVSAEMTTSLQGFVTAAATSDMYEVEAGKIATERTHNSKVNAFAAKMVTAHAATTAELKGLISNTKATPPAHIDDRRQGMIDELRGATDADFDKRYMSQQVDAHKEALILMRGYAKSGDVAGVKAFAAKTQKAVQMHLSMAEHLYGQLK
jgi:putative membrane protein